MVRLGFWQLDRLAQRRAFNAQVEAQIHDSPLDLNQGIPLNQLGGMEYRPVIARGTYDPLNQVLLRNQVNGSQPGDHLLTPLHIAGSEQSVLVDRGFIPMDQNSPAALAQYDQPGMVTVQGIIRLPHVPQFFGVPDPTLAPGQTRLAAWNAVNLARIQAQTPYALLPVYMEANPVPDESGSAAPGNPIASPDQPDLTEGPHLGYAIQWFSFAAVLALGYPFFVQRQFHVFLLDPERGNIDKRGEING
jgi:surfeit locus 1 family protein